MSTHVTSQAAPFRQVTLLLDPTRTSQVAASQSTLLLSEVVTKHELSERQSTPHDSSHAYSQVLVASQRKSQLPVAHSVTHVAPSAQAQLSVAVHAQPGPGHGEGSGASSPHAETRSTESTQKRRFRIGTG